MVTLEKYLQQSSLGAPPSAATLAPLADALQSLCGLLDPTTPIPSDLIALREALRRPAELDYPAAVEQLVQWILRAAAEQQQREERHLEEVRTIVALLEQAAQAACAGSDRAFERLRSLENSLQLAAGTRNLATLRQRVEEVLRFVRREIHTEAAAAEPARRLTEQVNRYRAVRTTARGTLAGRAACEAHLRDHDRSEAGARVAVVSLPTWSVLESRYDAATLVELREALYDNHLRLSIPAAAAFLWSPDTLVLLLAPTSAEGWDRSRPCVANFEHSLTINGRSATVALPYHFTLLPPAGADDVVRQIERMAGRPA